MCNLVRDLSENNILVQYFNKNPYLLVVIDSLGHNEFIPTFTLSKTLSRMKIERRWKKAVEILKNRFS